MKATESVTCKHCGAPVQPRAPFGHCARCLLQLGFGPLPEAANHPESMPHDKTRFFSDYEILERIGRGGMGIVYKARHIRLNRFVALKMILAEESASPALIERLRVEAEATANLDHPNIVPIYEVGEHDGQHFLSMKLIEGKSLSSLISKFGFHDVTQENSGPPTKTAQSKIAQLIAKIARAVHYAHERGILHRDLKPHNILIDARGEPHVTDFGLAKLLDKEIGLTRSSAVLGTPAYMAPEQASGKTKHLTSAGDVYSLGVILYELLTGRPPFRGETPVETLRQVTEDEPKHPTTLNDHADRELAIISLKCLAKNPSERYASAAALAQDLERWLGHEPICARPAGAVLRLRRWMQRKPAIAALIAILILGAVGTWVLLQQSRYAQQSESRAILENRKGVEEELNRLWESANAYVAVRSEVRSRCWPTEGIPQVSSGPQLRLLVGVYAHEKPVEAVTNFTPLLAFLEHQMTLALSNTVRLDLWVYRNNADAREALIRGDVGILRMGAGPYVEAKKANPGVHLLARQEPAQYKAVTRDGGANGSPS